MTLLTLSRYIVVNDITLSLQADRLDSELSVQVSRSRHRRAGRQEMERGMRAISEGRRDEGRGLLRTARAALELGGDAAGEKEVAAAMKKIDEEEAVDLATW
jgi:hypothetical protein